MEVDSSIDLILNEPSYLKTASNCERLSPEANPLDTAGIPNIAMGDMG